MAVGRQAVLLRHSLADRREIALDQRTVTPSAFREVAERYRPPEASDIAGVAWPVVVILGWRYRAGLRLRVVETAIGAGIRGSAVLKPIGGRGASGGRGPVMLVGWC